MDMHFIFSAAATIIAIVSFAPYIRSMLRGKTHPHAFSWLIWTIVAYIAGIIFCSMVLFRRQQIAPPLA